MPDSDAQVLLITTDAGLREIVRRQRPPGIALRCAAPGDVPTEAVSAADELWIDLDCAAGVALPPAARRVYFHSRQFVSSADLPPGLFVRKPCADTAIQALWAGVRRARVKGSKPAARWSTGTLPHWLLEFHEPGLRALCRKCVRQMPERLGYGDVSMYLHDQEQGLLTLAETTHLRPIDLAVHMGAADRHLMVAVARTGKLLVTADAAREWEAHGLRRPADERRYADGACLIAPLVSGGRLWGVLNFSRSERTALTEVGVPFEAVFAFLGRALRYARAYKRARTQARVDPLTALYNRRWMIEALAKEIRRGQRFHTPLAVIMADLDGLKAINDCHGHAAGDCVLRHVAGRLTSALRQFDSGARVGGDEFGILLPATDLDGARAVARRVLEAVRSDAAMFRGLTLPIRASLGVAQWEAGWGAAQLIEAADKAMYQAKQQGGNQLVCRPHDASRAVRLAGDSPGRQWPAPAPSGRPMRDTATPQPAESPPEGQTPAVPAADRDASSPSRDR